MKYIVAVNASPRSGWNTSQLVEAAAKGAKEAGATVDIIDLYKLEPFQGCISCLDVNFPGHSEMRIKRRFVGSVG